MSSTHVAEVSALLAKAKTAFDQAKKSKERPKQPEAVAPAQYPAPGKFVPLATLRALVQEAVTAAVAPLERQLEEQGTKLDRICSDLGVSAGTSITPAVVAAPAAPTLRAVG